MNKVQLKYYIYIRFLLQVGVDRVEMLHRAGSVPDIELLEQVLLVLIDEQSYFFPLNDPKVLPADEVQNNCHQLPEALNGPDRDREALQQQLKRWLRFLATSKNFELMLRCLSAEVRSAANSLLMRLDGSAIAHDCEVGNLISLFKHFTTS